MNLDDALKCADDPEMNSSVETALAAAVRRQREEIEQLRACAEAAEAELKKAREQEPVAWMDADGDVYKTEPTENWCPPHTPLYLHPAPHKGATHCDDCGLTWLDDGLNPLGCPYCKQAPNSRTVRDAERYRYVREHCYVEVQCDSPRNWYDPEKLDAAIDRLLEE